MTTKHRSVGGFCYGEPTPWDRRWSGVSLRRLVTLSALIAVLIAAGCKGGGSGSGGGGSSQITGIFFSGPTSVALGSSIQLTIVADVAGGGTDSDTNDFNGSLTPSFVNSNPLAASVTPVNSPDSILLSVGGLSAGQSTMITETLVVNGTTTFTAHTTDNLAFPGDQHRYEIRRIRCARAGPDHRRKHRHGQRLRARYVHRRAHRLHPLDDVNLCRGGWICRRWSERIAFNERQWTVRHVRFFGGQSG